jgi:tRNA (guanine-N7-)-methyltransferase
LIYSQQEPHLFRSFVRRNSRETTAQAHARSIGWPGYGLTIDQGQLNTQSVFDKEAPLFVEIGFGSGTSLLALACANKDKNFIGIETYHPGIGNLMQQIIQQKLTNLRIYQEDAVDVLQQCFPANSIDGILIFFPDPWQKRKHHQRRLIQPDFIKKLVNKLKPEGVIHLATDWEDYAVCMMKVMSNEEQLTNLFGETQFASRSSYRPCLTKFEQRAIKEKRKIRELQFCKNKE